MGGGIDEDRDKARGVCEGALFAFYIDSLKHLIASQRNLLEEAS